MKKPIETRADLRLLVDRFYVRLLQDDLLRPIFVDVVGIDLEEHLPVLVDFWEGILLQSNHYRRNAMAVHLDLNRKFPLEKVHFDRWLAHFNATVDGNFSGPKAELAKTRALSIATVMQVKIFQEKGIEGKNLI